MKILIAEDEAVSRLRLQKFLKKWGHDVTAAAHGGEAIEQFSDDTADIVITDWMMPQIDGPALIRHIRKQSKTFVYIIILTTRGEKEDVVTGLFDIGADDYIIKPFDPDELRARISVGERTVRLERSLREYSEGLEEIVRRQTRLIRQTQEETIVKLLTALETRDQETGGHVRRISMYSTILARELGWSASKIDDLQLASPMHDIGKIGVPDRILRKAGPLTPEEFEVIKQHTTFGGQIFDASAYPMLEMAHDIALYHHERWNGTGYPDGLAGEDIPEAARIVSIVDVFDALSSDRVYRKACPPEKVINIMENGRGSHFDPDLFDIFMQALPRFRQILASTPA